jgi:hypothetical protein
MVYDLLHQCTCTIRIVSLIRYTRIDYSIFCQAVLLIVSGWRTKLIVDIKHIPNMSTGSRIAPIGCVVNSTHRNIVLLQNSSVQFKSRIIKRYNYCSNCMTNNQYSFDDNI